MDHVTMIISRLRLDAVHLFRKPHDCSFSHSRYVTGTRKL